MKMFLICVSITLISLVSFTTSCPSPSQLSPCYCNYVASSFRVTCPGLENEQVLVEAVFALRTTSSFSRLTIQDGNFVFLPHDVFKNVRFQELEILSSSFMALTDTDVALEGLEEDLTSLVIKNSNVLNDWDWTVLKDLKNLVSIHVDVDLDIISKDIRRIKSSSLGDLSLADNKISFVHDEAFAGFKELKLLSLKNNFISTLKRSMLPNPADKLTHLDLSENQIEQLPSNIFENVPSLQSLHLSSNKLLSLGQGIFEKIWTQLKSFDAMDNQLRCDCRMEWLIKLKFPDSTNAVCDQPSQLRGKKVNELTSLDIWC